MVRTQIQLTDEHYRSLKQLAASQRMSLAALIRQSLDTFLVGTPIPDPTEARMRAKAAIGRYSSGQTDVSSHHDDHLTDAFGA